MFNSEILGSVFVTVISPDGSGLDAEADLDSRESLDSDLGIWIASHWAVWEVTVNARKYVGVLWAVA